MAYLDKSIAVVIPAYNEAQSIELVINELQALQDDSNNSGKSQCLIDDIVVCDNASTDNTALKAQSAGARVVHETVQGYGAACLAAINALQQPDIVVFVDADHSVLVTETISLLDCIIEGADLAIGCRIASKQQHQALTPQQRFGNVLASYLIRLIWKQPVTDLGPFRAIKYSALKKLAMQDQRFGWTVEMQVKAIQQGFIIREMPVTSLKRIGRSKISGTVTGTIGAALGIFGMIFRLYKQEKQQQISNTKHREDT